MIDPKQHPLYLSLMAVLKDEVSPQKLDTVLSALGIVVDISSEYGKHRIAEAVKKFIFENHEHHDGHVCNYYDYPYVNSLSLEKFINKYL